MRDEKIDITMIAESVTITGSEFGSYIRAKGVDIDDISWPNEALEGKIAELKGAVNLANKASSEAEVKLRKLGLVADQIKEAHKEAELRESASVRRIESILRRVVEVLNG